MTSFHSLVKAVAKGNYTAANQSFGGIMQQLVADRLQVEKTRIFKEESDGDSEYQKYFRSMLDKHGYDSPADIPADKKDDFFNAVDAGYKAKNESTQYPLTEQQVLMEGAFSKLMWDFCVFVAQEIVGTAYVVVVFFVWLLSTAVFRPIAGLLGMIGAIPSVMKELMDEIKRAQRIYETQKHLSPQDIQRVSTAAKRVYDSMSPRTKAVITSYSNKLSSMNMETPQAQRQAAEMVITLQNIVAKAEAK